MFFSGNNPSFVQMGSYRDMHRDFRLFEFIRELSSNSVSSRPSNTCSKYNFRLSCNISFR